MDLFSTPERQQCNHMHVQNINITLTNIITQNQNVKAYLLFRSQNWLMLMGTGIRDKKERKRPGNEPIFPCTGMYMYV